MVSSSDSGAGPADHPGRASASEDSQQQTLQPFPGGRKPAPRSARIISMQDSNAASTTTRAGGGARREPVMDRKTTML
jgi:hypothetical protein